MTQAGNRARKIGILLAWIMLVLLLLLAGIFAYLNTSLGRQALSYLLSEALEEPVHVSGKIRPLPEWPPALRFRKFTVAPDKQGNPEIASIRQMDVSVALWPLLRGEIALPKLLVRDSHFNLQAGPSAAADREPLQFPRIGMLRLDNTTLNYKDPRQRIDVRLRADTSNNNVHIKGSGIYKAKAFKMDAQTPKLLEIATDNPMPLKLVLNVGHTMLDARGTVRDLFHLKGMDVMLRVKGADASELFPLLGIALPPTAPYDLRGKLDYADEKWRFNQFSGKMGDSDLSGDLTWDTGCKRPMLSAKFISRQLDFKDLAPLIGIAPENPVSAEQKNEAAAQEASPYVIPNVPLDISRISAMDAQVTFTGKKVISESLPLDDFTMKLSLNDRLLKLQPVRFGTANGNVAAWVTLDARTHPVMAMADFTFSRLSLERIMEKISGKLGRRDLTSGYIGGTAKIKGYGKSMHEMLGTSEGVAGFGMEGGSLSNLFMELAGLDIAQSLGFMLSGDAPVPIRCVIASFRIKSGVMSAEHLVLDTTDTKLKADGSLDLKSEEMDLLVKAQPKDATLMTVRSPIHVGGTLKHPDVSIEKSGLAARMGVAAALSAVLTPIAGLIAFVEPGLGKDSNCMALLQDMHHLTGKNTRTDQVPDN